MIALMTALLCLSVGVIVVFNMLRHPVLIPLLVLAIFVLDALLLNNLPYFELGSINIGVLDLLLVLLIAQSALRLILTRRKMRYSAILLGILLGISLARGIWLFGLERAVSFSRSYLCFYASFIAIAILPISLKLVSRLLFFWGWSAWFLLGLAIFRWVMVAAGTLQNPLWVGPTGVMIRVLNAAQANFLLETFLLCWVLPPGFRVYIPGHKYLPYTTLAAVVILQHRTIWVSLLVLTILLIVYRIRTRHFILATIVVLLIFIGLLLSTEDVVTPVIGATQNLSTFEWRVEGWKALLAAERYKDKLDYILGQPFGTGYERYLLNSPYPVEVSPHNFYLQTFLNIGLAGLIVLLHIYGKNLMTLFTQRKDGIQFALFFLLISHLLFFLTYSPSYEQGLLLGLATIHDNRTNLRPFTDRTPNHPYATTS